MLIGIVHWLPTRKCGWAIIISLHEILIRTLLSVSHREVLSTWHVSRPDGLHY